VIITLANTNTYSYTVICLDTHTQLFYGSMDLDRNNPGEPVPEKNIQPLTPICLQ